MKPVLWGTVYRVCSGQSWSNGPRRWAVMLVDIGAGAWCPDPKLPARCWRAVDKRGRTRLFASAEAAGRLCARLEAVLKPGERGKR
jgi:hypothetical protein